MNQIGEISINDIPTKPTSVTPLCQPPTPALPKLKVLGLGGGGSNAVNRMIELGLKGVDFIAANTDSQALQASLAQTKILLGPKTTRGLGAGGNPAIGQAAAEESWKELASALKGAELVFLTASMGGGTGTGAIPVAAKIARALGAVTIAIVTTPFWFEMGRRQRNASEGLQRLRPHTDTLITIPNDRLLCVAPPNLSLEIAFRLADDVLRQGVQAISELVAHTGVINVDFANVRHLMKLGGGALMAIGQGEGNDKVRKAIEQALHHPLLDIGSIENAAGVLVNFTCGDDLTLFEIEEALNMLQAQAGSQAEIVFGVTQNNCMRDRVEAILIVTGLGATTLEETLQQVEAKQPRLSANLTKPIAASANPDPLHPQTTPTIEAGLSAQPLSVDTGLTMPVCMANDLDVPAFMRKMQTVRNHR